MILPKYLRCLLAQAVVLLSSCYQGDNDPGNTVGAYSDDDHNGVPDTAEADPSLDDNNRDPADNPAGDFDGDGRANDADVDDDNDWILDDVAPADLVSAVQPIARAECEAVASCCPGGWSPTAIDRCVLQTTGRLAVALAQSWVDEWVTLEPSALSTCLDAQSFACEMPPRERRMPFECREYLVGHRVARSGCSRTPDCERSSFCSGDGHPAGQVGPGPYVVDLWGGSEWARARERVCLPYALVGESCDPNGGSFCASDLKCQFSDEGSWCVDPVDEGGECHTAGIVERGDDCAEGLYCDAESQTCAARSLGGALCLEDRDCGSMSCNPVTLLCDDLQPAFDYCGEGERYGE